jgi:hypothetical protein
VQNITIQYSTNGSAGPFFNLTNSTAVGENGAGSWTWNITNTTNLSLSHARIKVFDRDMTLASALGPAATNFTVRGLITDIKPGSTAGEHISVEGETTSRA